MWTTPLDGWVKINFDAAISPSCAMAAAIAHDSQGVILDWKTKLLPTVSPLVGEALACLLAVSLAAEKGWKFCYFEGDAKLEVEACCEAQSSPCEMYGIVLDILSYKDYFHAWDFLFIVREASEVAHLLAAKASSHYSRGLSFNFTYWPC